MRSWFEYDATAVYRDSDNKYLYSADFGTLTTEEAAKLAEDITNSENVVEFDKCRLITDEGFTYLITTKEKAKNTESDDIFNVSYYFRERYLYDNA